MLLVRLATYLCSLPTTALMNTKQEVDNEFDSEAFALNLYKRSVLEAATFPLDKDFVVENLKEITQKDYFKILSYYLNNFPNIYCTTFLLLTMDKYLINFTESDWIELHKSVSSQTAINTLISFYQSYLKVVPSLLLLNSTRFVHDYIYTIDDHDYIHVNDLSINLEKLRSKILGCGFTALN